MKKVIKSFGYAYSGIAYATGTQLNFKIHLLAAIATITLAITLNISHLEWIIITLCIGIVIILELLNTAIEVLVDLVSPGYNKKAGIVKDVVAGAVFMAAILAVIVGLLVFTPKILAVI